jgi:hypothetical protein
MTEPPPPARDPEDDVVVPLFRTWRRAYLFIVAFFVVQVVLYTLLTRAAS